MNIRTFFYMALISAVFMTQHASCMEETIEQQIQDIEIQLNKLEFLIGGKKQQLAEVKKIQNNTYLFQQHYVRSGYSSYDTYSNSLATKEQTLKEAITDYQIEKRSLEKQKENLEKRIDKLRTTTSSIKSKKI